VFCQFVESGKFRIAKGASLVAEFMEESGMKDGGLVVIQHLVVLVLGPIFKFRVTHRAHQLGVHRVSVPGPAVCTAEHCWTEAAIIVWQLHQVFRIREVVDGVGPGSWRHFRVFGHLSPL